VLDTHAWVWWIERDRRLGARAVAVLDDLPATSRPYLCDISLWEAAMLVERRRLAFSIPLADWLQAAAHPRAVRLLPVTPAVAAETAALPAALHRDPADRLIVATCRTHDLPLLTRDTRILRSRLVTRWSPSRR
jgi:PIN domain nuclease of toxin-antitoxin system